MGKKGIWKTGVYASNVQAGRTKNNYTSTCNDAAILTGQCPMRLELKILSDPATLGQVRLDIENFAIKAGLAQDCAGRVVLAVDEALTNIIRHAYEYAKDQPIEILMTASDNELEITIRDYGQNVHPSAIRSRDLDDVRPGGLGVHIMHECMDSVDFSPAAQGGGTILKLTKRI